MDKATVESVETILISAIYFKADWVKQFKKENTLKKDFTSFEGKHQVDMMCMKEKL